MGIVLMSQVVIAVCYKLTDMIDCQGNRELDGEYRVRTLSKFPKTMTVKYIALT
jgi:hypothetical protein